MAAENNTQILEGELKEKFLKILKDNGIADEVDKITIIEPPELKGEHMATATVYGKVDFKDTSKKPKNLFIKKFSNNDMHTEMVKKMRLMEKEATFYTKFLPELKKFTSKFEGCKNLVDFFPKCLYGDDDMVVFNNLVLDDTYIMLSKEERQDLPTAKVVLGNLARFHAATSAFIQSIGRETFRERWEAVCAEAFNTEAVPMIKETYDSGIGTCSNILKCHPVAGSDEALEVLGNAVGKSFGIVMEAISTKPEDKFVAITHGDCWNNNMLFKVDKDKNIVDHLFVDLQITRFSSPSTDLAYFLYTSVKNSVRQNHQKELLQHYYDILNDTLSKFNIDIPITFEELLEDYKRRSWIGFFISLSFMSAIGAMKEMDMEKMGTTPEEAMAYFTTVIDNWVKKNPDLAEQSANDIVSVIQEQRKLAPGVI